MPALRKSRRGEVKEKQIKMVSVDSSSSSETVEQEKTQDTTTIPSTHPVYGQYSRDSNRFSSQGFHRPRPNYSHWSQSSMMTDVQSESPPQTPQLGFPLMPPQALSSYSEAGTRSSSPSQAAQTPFRSQETIRPLLPNAPSGYLTKEWVVGGQIAQLHTRDDKAFINGWTRKVYTWFAPLLAIATLSLYWLYFAKRIEAVVAAMKKYGGTFPLAWVFIAIEISVAIPIFMQTFWSLFILKKRNRPQLRLTTNDVPPVDVFITCCGEDNNLIMDTVRAACDLDYPQDRFRVILLDDGKNDDLKAHCKELQDTYNNVFYKARPKFPGQPHHFKAGNLNYGLDEVHYMPGGAAPYVAALDADMIPEQHWLRSVLPHLLIDQKMALACPPQLFYNIPKGDPLCQSLDFFVHVSEPVKDALGVAWCTGSGYVLRREAIDEIGGFPCGSLAEDVATSTLMLGRGWKTAFVHEALQFGTVPEDYGSHLKQRTRWAIGTVDTSFKLRFCLWGENIKHMTFAQRMSSFIYAFLSLFNIFLVLSLFALPVVLISGKPLVAYATDDQLRWLIRLCFASFMSNRLCEFILYIPSGYNIGQRGCRSQLWMSPYIALTIIRSFVLPTWLGGQAQAFKPTGSLESALNERNAKIRAPVYRRIWTVVVNYLAGFHVAYVYFTLVAVVMSSYQCFAKVGIREQLLCLATHAFWPPLSWVIVVSAFWIPIQYACDPPSVPDREDLLDRDPKTGVAHPKAESKKDAFIPQTFLFEFEYTFTTVFTTLLFVASFIF